MVQNMPSNIFAKQQKKNQTYTVRKGDSALRIAIEQKVSLKKLIALNRLDKNATVYIGQTLKLPRTAFATKAPKAPSKIKTIRADQKKNIASNQKQSPMLAPAQFNVGNLHSRKGVIYGEIISQPGETISLLAVWLNLSEKTLRRLNNFTAQTLLAPGQKILLCFSDTTRTEFEKRRNLFH